MRWSTRPTEPSRRLGRAIARAALLAALLGSTVALTLSHPWTEAAAILGLHAPLFVAIAWMLGCAVPERWWPALYRLAIPVMLLELAALPVTTTT